MYFVGNAILDGVEKLSIVHGGQTVLTQNAWKAVQKVGLPAQTQILSLGVHALTSKTTYIVT